MPPETRASARRRTHARSGPVIQTPSSRQSICSVAAIDSHRHLAPGQTAPRRRHRRRAGTRARGQRDARPALPDPQANLGRRDRTCTTSTLVRSGNSGWCSMRAAKRGQIDRLGIRRQRTCNAGCPCRSPPDRPSIGSDSVSTSSASGISAQSVSGAPMLTRVSPSPASSQASTPRSVRRSSADLPVSSIRCRAMQRVALPHAADSDPSALKNVSRAATASSGSITASWSNPTPRCRSPSAARQLRRHDGTARAAIDHHEVIAKPMHFHERQANRITVIAHIRPYTAPV